MEIVTRIAWILLAFVHAAPALVAFRPSLAARLYGAAGSGDLALLMTHRGVLFLAVVLACLYAAWEPTARPTAALVAGISVVGFLIHYALAGLPVGPLRTVALVDAFALIPLACVLLTAWPRATLAT